MSVFFVECPCPCGVRFPVDSQTMRVEKAEVSTYYNSYCNVCGCVPGSCGSARLRHRCACSEGGPWEVRFDPEPAA